MLSVQSILLLEILLLIGAIFAGIWFASKNNLPISIPMFVYGGIIFGAVLVYTIPIYLRLSEEFSREHGILFGGRGPTIVVSPQQVQGGAPKLTTERDERRD